MVVTVQSGVRFRLSSKITGTLFRAGYTPALSGQCGGRITIRVPQRITTRVPEKASPPPQHGEAALPAPQSGFWPRIFQRWRAKNAVTGSSLAE
jgi:hypothetical protein